MKYALAFGEILQPIAEAMVDMMRKRGFCQAGGFGEGSTFLVGAIAALDPSIRIGLAREQRKQYGFRRIVEGSLDIETPTLLVDDLINSGRSAVDGATQFRAEGHNIVGVLTVFDFAWGRGRQFAARNNLTLESLASLHSRSKAGSSTSP